jgi:hypothetical protein
MLQIKKATKEKLFLRMAVTGPAGSGKTYTAMRLAFSLGAKVLVIDSENGSARKYAGESPDGIEWQFDIIELPNYHPNTYAQAVKMAVDGGYDVIIIDSLSHAWEGEGGALDLQHKAGGRYQDWAKVTPIHQRMIQSILTAGAHTIVTMRSKMDYAVENDERGKLKVTKVGLQPVQRKGVEYEFDVVLELDQSHYGQVTKTRCSGMTDAEEVRPGPDFFTPLLSWLNTGENQENPARVLSGEELTRRKQGFAARIIRHIPYYEDNEDIAEALKNMGITYSPEDEESIIENLWDYARANTPSSRIDDNEDILPYGGEAVVTYG